jgi:hypothetical protein
MRGTELAIPRVALDLQMFSANITELKPHCTSSSGYYGMASLWHRRRHDEAHNIDNMPASLHKHKRQVLRRAHGRTVDRRCELWRG